MADAREMADGCIAEILAMLDAHRAQLGEDREAPLRFAMGEQPPPGVERTGRATSAAIDLWAVVSDLEDLLKELGIEIPSWLADCDPLRGDWQTPDPKAGGFLDAGPRLWALLAKVREGKEDAEQP